MPKQNIKNVKKPSARRTTANVVEKTKMVSFPRAISNLFKKYFQFSGVATRAEYWWVILFVVITGFILIKLAFVLQPVNLLLSGLCAFIWLLFGIIIFVPLWALQSRRLHDAGFTAKILWISFAFFVYSILIDQKIAPSFSVISWISSIWGIFVLILFLFPSKKLNNRYIK